MTIKYATPGTTENNTLRVICNGYYFSDNGWLNGPDGENVVGHSPIPEASTQAFITPRMSILHSNAGPRSTPWWNLIAYWNRKDIVGEAHFQLATDGFIAQAIPIIRKADCNYKANSFYMNGVVYGAISFETQDEGSASLAWTPWSLHQLHVLAQVNKALVIQCDIHCSQPAYWQSSGIGHHCLHKEWSSFVGKTCPGAARIAQMDWIRGQCGEGAAAFHQAMGTSCTPPVTCRVKTR